MVRDTIYISIYTIHHLLEINPNNIENGVIDK